MCVVVRNVFCCYTAINTHSSTPVACFTFSLSGIRAFSEYPMGCLCVGGGGGGALDGGCTDVSGHTRLMFSDQCISCPDSRTQDNKHKCCFILDYIRFVALGLLGGGFAHSHLRTREITLLQ